MTGLLALTLLWLVLPLPCLVLIGKCIQVGQAGEEERHAADAVPPAGSGQADGGSSPVSCLDAAAVPTQRGPVQPVSQHAEVVTSE